jgi:hypothetical protein
MTDKKIQEAINRLVSEDDYDITPVKPKKTDTFSCDEDEDLREAIRLSLIVETPQDVIIEMGDTATSFGYEDDALKTVLIPQLALDSFRKSWADEKKRKMATNHNENILIHHPLIMTFLLSQCFMNTICNLYLTSKTTMECITRIIVENPIRSMYFKNEKNMMAFALNYDSVFVNGIIKPTLVHVRVMTGQYSSSSYYSSLEELDDYNGWFNNTLQRLDIIISSFSDIRSMIENLSGYDSTITLNFYATINTIRDIDEKTTQEEQLMLLTTSKPLNFYNLSVIYPFKIGNFLYFEAVSNHVFSLTTSL